MTHVLIFLLAFSALPAALAKAVRSDDEALRQMESLLQELDDDDLLGMVASMGGECAAGMEQTVHVDDAIVLSGERALLVKQSNRQFPLPPPHAMEMNGEREKGEKGESLDLVPHANGISAAEDERQRLHLKRACVGDVGGEGTRGPCECILLTFSPRPTRNATVWKLLKRRL